MDIIKGILAIIYVVWVTIVLVAMCVAKLNGVNGWHNAVSIVALAFHIFATDRAVKRALAQ